MENLRETDSGKLDKVPELIIPTPDPGGRAAEFAETREAVEREFADAVRDEEEPSDRDEEADTPPSFENVEIDERKISEYALNPDHEVGKHKHRVISSATGLDRSDAPDVERQIRDGVKSGEPILGRKDQHGQRWSVDVPLIGPSGTMTVRTGWILRNDEAEPRMTTISFPPKAK